MIAAIRPSSRCCHRGISFANVGGGGRDAPSSTHFSGAAQCDFSVGCDDTGKALKEEVKEIDKEEVKRDLKEAAATVDSAAQKVGQKVDETAPKVVEGVKEAAKETEKVIDKVDKKAAEEIRRD